jgi:DNA-binding MarR family transcriptional regulator
MTYHRSNLLGALAIGIGDLQRATVAGAVDLDAAALSTLLAVFARPGSSVGDVALTTQLTHSGAVRVIDRLCAISLLERSAAQDRRAVALRCTQTGAEAAQRALDARGAALGSLIETLSAAERAELARLATKLLAHLPHTRADAWRICRLCEHAVCRGDDCPVGKAVR